VGVRGKLTSKSKTHNKIEKVCQGEEQPVTHTKQKLYMVLGMDVESQMEEPNEKSIVKSG
jgi:hypothetical protein